MALPAGTRLGVYEITTQIGAGGMGEVYRAIDSNLKRSVAIKVLPASVGGDAERFARFQREAEVLAALNHPNIGAIYGLEKTPDFTALVMELVEGEDLSQRIARGALPIDEALPIAKQIADALEAAHEQGIIHRDLKPANIKVRADSTVKVLDFGLAKAMEAPFGSSPSLSMSPTLSLHATSAGVILGTAAYMSPEQARGRVVDKRTDVWAFGCVLFETLSGARAFDGEDLADTIGAVIHKEPAWERLPDTTPATVLTVLQRCLQKDPKERIRDIGDVQLALKGVFDRPTPPVAVAVPPDEVPRPLWTRAVPIAVAALVAGAIVGAAAWMLRPVVPTPAVTRFALTLGEGQEFNSNNSGSLAFSPDGTRLVYVANNQLYLRNLSDLEARPIRGTQESPSPTSPVFSPDGEFLAFNSRMDRAVKKIAVTGGASVTICPADTPFLGMSWDVSGIVFGHRNGIMRVPASGGQPTLAASVKSGELAYGPQVLPGGDWVLFAIATEATPEGWDKAQIVVQSLKTPERKTLVSGGSEARYVPTGLSLSPRGERESGVLVYALRGVLFAVPFDVRHLAVTGGPAPIVEGVKRSTTGNLGTAHFSISRAGSLVFVPGPAVSSPTGQLDLALIDRMGAVKPLKLPPGAYRYPRLSPDGKRIAVGTEDGKDAIVWIYDVSGGTSIRQLTLVGRNRVPVWAADSEHVAFQSDREGDLAIWWQRADGTTAAERLTKPDNKDTAHVPESWSPDGKTLLFSVEKASSFAVAALSLPEKKVTPVDRTESAFPPAASFSPDGKWVAYSVAAPGAIAGSLLVQPFPPNGATYPVSKGNGIHATWSPDGKELFYGAAAGPSMVVVSVTTRPAFVFGNPVPVPRAFNEPGPSVERANDITRDGKQFLGVVTAGQYTASGAAAAPQIQVVLNWVEELKARVPAK